MTEAKRWFELECRHCGGRYLEMVNLLFHRCPAHADAHKGPQWRAKAAGQARVATDTQGVSPSGGERP